LIKKHPIPFKTYLPEEEEVPVYSEEKVSITPDYAIGKLMSTRKAYGNGLLKARQSNSRVVGLDGDTKNSTFSVTLFDKYPDSFIECFIAEQNMVGVASGLACRNKIAFCSTFACFFSRAADQIRIAGISGNTVKMCGSHSGCSIG
jgi:transketolase